VGIQFPGTRFLREARVCEYGVAERFSVGEYATDRLLVCEGFAGLIC